MLPEKYRNIKKLFSSKVTITIKELLETKHLYQSINLNEKDLWPKDNEKVSDQDMSLFFDEMMELSTNNWYPSDPAVKNPDPILGQFTRNYLHFNAPDIKSFCNQCDRLEAMNVVTCENLLSRGCDLTHVYRINNKPVQIFVISYLCQSCKSIPEVFIIRREGNKLTLSGKSPIEHIVVPKVIPKKVEKFYSGAILAHQSGQTLAGNFFLRTLIEQFAYQKTKGSSSVDQAIDLYMETLEEDFKKRFPSFRELYGALSNDIHSAEGSSEIFEDAMSKIVEHFKARELFSYK